MDWLKQSEEMIKMWAEAQQQAMSGWLGAMKDFTQPQAAGVWEKTLETWENAVKSMLETQAQWVRLWAGSVTASKGASQETMQGAARVKEMTEQWVAFQQQIWDSWFEMARQLDPASLGDKAPEQALAAWQEALQKALDAQQAWFKAWTEAQKSGDK